MMFGLVIFAAVFAAANAIVCLPQLCGSIKQEPLNCAGSVIKSGGFCGCTDVCAKVEGEACQATVMFGSPVLMGFCDTGLECKAGGSGGNVGLLGAFGRGTCVKSTKSKRSTMTKCEQMRRAALMTMVIFAQKVTPKCDADGSFLPMQCDFSGHCFCVNSEGDIQGERVQGKITCPAIK